MPALSLVECTGVKILSLVTIAYLAHQDSLEHSHLAKVLRMQSQINRYCQNYNVACL